MPDRICQRAGCGNLIRSSRRQDTRWCSRSCEGKARRAARRKARFEDEHGPADELLPVEDQSLAELHERASAPQHWADIDAGHVDDDLIEFSDEYDDDGLDDEQTARIRIMLDDEDQCRPLETWQRWKSYGRRHGTEDPGQTADRVERHKAAERAAGARRDANTTGRVQSRFDSRTAANVAGNGHQSRSLNARHVEQPPPMVQGFDFRNAPAIGHQGTVSGQRPGHADYAWDLGTTGFVY
jgi:hypothetical protein